LKKGRGQPFLETDASTVAISPFTLQFTPLATTVNDLTLPCIVSHPTHLKALSSQGQQRTINRVDNPHPAKKRITQDSTYCPAHKIISNKF
jgi:hypothetical protein